MSLAEPSSEVFTRLCGASSESIRNIPEVVILSQTAAGDSHPVENKLLMKRSGSDAAGGLNVFLPRARLRAYMLKRGATPGRNTRALSGAAPGVPG
jgi:hypothetical protein